MPCLYWRVSGWKFVVLDRGDGVVLGEAERFEFLVFGIFLYYMSFSSATHGRGINQRLALTFKWPSQTSSGASSTHASAFQLKSGSIIIRRMIL